MQSSVADFATWLAIPLGMAKSAWAPSPEATVLDSAPLRPPITALLGQFDPVLHGWRDREWLLGDYGSRIVSSNGIFHPTVIVANRCVGTWTVTKGSVVVTYFETVDATAQQRIATDAHEIERYLSSTRDG
jgi:hypothetical protein